MPRRMLHMHLPTWLRSIRSPHLLLWQRPQTNGRQTEEPICSATRFRSRRCSLRQARRALCTALWRQALWPRPTPLPRVFCWWSRTYTRLRASSFRAYSTYPRAPWQAMRCPFSAIIPTSMHAVRPAARCSVNPAFRRLWT